jgi:hypothetical protein
MTENINISTKGSLAIKSKSRLNQSVMKNVQFYKTKEAG